MLATQLLRQISQPTTHLNADLVVFPWKVLVNQAFPNVNAATGRAIESKGTPSISPNGRWLETWGSNTLVNFPATVLPTAQYTALWVGCFSHASEPTARSMLRTTGGGFRLESYTSAGGVYISATHTGAAGLTSPAAVSYVHDTRPWIILITYNGTTANIEVRQPDGTYTISTTASVGMNAGTGTIDLSTTTGSQGSYAFGYAPICMSAGLRARVLQPGLNGVWGLFKARRLFVPQTAAAGLPTLSAAGMTGITPTGGYPTVSYTY